MQCLCELTKKNISSEAANDLSIDLPELDDNGNPIAESSKTPTQICDPYFKDKSNSKNLGTAISLIIIVINTVLKTVIIALITWIGEDTVSE
jgi:hypothetical protein